MPQQKSKLVDVLKKYETEIVNECTLEQLAVNMAADKYRDADLKDQNLQFIVAIRQALQAGGHADTTGLEWNHVREILLSLSNARASQGFNPSETALFVFAFKKPLFNKLRAECGTDINSLESELWITTTILDQLGLFTTEVCQKAREAIILRQQQDMLELSTPVVKLWDGILAVPLIGTLDSARTQIVMENLLQVIVDTGSEIAIIDITGVPTVDTLVAQHLLKTIAATRLMGAECIISGIRPQIAQTIVHLGVELGDVTTKATLADAFMLALDRMNRKIVVK